MADSLESQNVPTYPDSIWVRQTRTRYVALCGLYMTEITRSGKRWTIEMVSIINGEIIQMDTRSTLSVAVQMAETKASVHSDAHTKKENQ